MAAPNGRPRFSCVACGGTGTSRTLLLLPCLHACCRVCLDDALTPPSHSSLSSPREGHNTPPFFRNESSGKNPQDGSVKLNEQWQSEGPHVGDTCEVNEGSLAGEELAPSQVLTNGIASHASTDQSDNTKLILQPESAEDRELNIRTSETKTSDKNPDNLPSDAKILYLPADCKTSGRVSGPNVEDCQGSALFSCPRCLHTLLLSRGVVDKLKPMSDLFASKKISEGESCDGFSDNDMVTERTEKSQEENGRSDLDSFLQPPCSDCGQSATSVHAYFCATCDAVLCSACAHNCTVHAPHTVCTLSDILVGRMGYVRGLWAGARERRSGHAERVEQIQSARAHLDESRARLKQAITDRAVALCRAVEQRRDILIKELDKEHAACADQYARTEHALCAEMRALDDAISFVDDVFSPGEFLISASTTRHPDGNLTNGSLQTGDRVGGILPNHFCGRLGGNLLRVHGETTNHINQLVNQAVASQRAVEVLSLKLDLPPGSGQSRLSDLDTELSPPEGGSAQGGGVAGGVERLFGALVRGTVACGGPERAATFTVDLRWPACFVTTRSRDFVIAGKTGAFAAEGKLLFFDRHGNLVSTHPLERDCLPIAMTTTPNGRVIVSDTRGRLLKFSSCGRLLETWEDRYDAGGAGVGYLAAAGDGGVWVTSRGGEMRKICAVDGRLMGSMKLGGVCGRVHRPPGGKFVAEAANDLLTGTVFATNEGGFSCGNGSSGIGTKLECCCTASTAESYPSMLPRSLADDLPSAVISSLRQNDELISAQDPICDVASQQNTLERKSEKGSSDRSDLFPGGLLEINSMAITSEDNVVVSVPERKRIYVFSPTGRLLFAYPPESEGCNAPEANLKSGGRESESEKIANDAEHCEGSEGISEKPSNGFFEAGTVTNYDEKKMDGSNVILNDLAGCGDSAISAPQLISEKIIFEPPIFVEKEKRSSSSALKCPSSVCCDPFDNILVADFTGDCVHLVSPSGTFLGRLLSKSDGVSCPTFVTLDPDGGHLYVGQYGGDVMVFGYMSRVKRA